MVAMAAVSGGGGGNGGNDGMLTKSQAAAMIAAALKSRPDSGDKSNRQKKAEERANRANRGRLPEGQTCKAGTCNLDHDTKYPGKPCYADPRVAISIPQVPRTRISSSRTSKPSNARNPLTLPFAHSMRPRWEPWFMLRHLLASSARMPLAFVPDA